MKIGINGFGRIGKLFFKAAFEDNEFNEDFEIVAVNDIGDIKTMAHLLRFDSTFGRFKEDVKVEEKNLIVGNRKISFLQERDPSNLPWSKLSVDYVVESTGFFTDRELAEDPELRSLMVSIPFPWSSSTLSAVMGTK